MKTISAGKAGIFSALLASACCIGPLLFVALGLGGGAAFLGRYHWLFLAGGAAVLAWAWIRFFREKRACAGDAQQPMVGRNTALLMLIAATAVVLGFGALNITRYLPATSAAQSRAPLPAGLSRVTIPVEGLTCVTCEFAVNAALRRTEGVKSAQAHVASNNAVVEYDPARTNVAKLVGAINATGYRATLPQK